MSAVTDLQDRTFGRLTVLRRDGSLYKGQAAWLCACLCGRSKTIVGSSLTKGATTSCGCLKAPRASAFKTTHGLSRHPVYKVWAGMIDRCTREASHAFKDYGGRGIQVCERWRQGVEFFVEDMGMPPFKGAQIDRERVDGHYEPGNCRWATSKANNRNKRNNRLIEWQGVTRPISELAELHGLTYAILSQRLASGWPLQIALETPIGGRYRKPGRRPKEVVHAAG